MGVVHVAGLGPGAIASIPHGTVEMMDKGRPLYLRTERHPSVDYLRQKRLAYVSLDRFYEKAESFSSLYSQIANFLAEEANRLGEVVYLLPGHPGVAERSVQLLKALSAEGIVDVRMGTGQSFIDALLSSIDVDPVEGLLWLDAATLQINALQPRVHTVIMQLYNQDVASQVKVLLAEVYGDEWPVTVVRAAGIPGEESVRTIPLFELDRGVPIDHLTTLYVPPLNGTGLYGEWSELVDLVATLRSLNGCLWDKERTHASLRSYAVEEAYEVVHAIAKGDVDDLVEELGDLLLQVLLHSQIGCDRGEFQIRDVIRTLSAKLIRHF